MRKGLLSRTRRGRNRHCRRLLFQPLEPRVVLAGNVTASVSGDTLRITGDADANSILVSTFEDPERGTGFRVESLDINGELTTINDEEEPQEFFRVKNLSVDLRGGDDTLAVTNDLDLLLECLGMDGGGVEASQVDGELFIRGSVTIKTGEGDNIVGFGPGEIGGSLLIQGGKGLDEIGLCEVIVGKTATILAGDGGSFVQVQGIVADDLIVKGGKHTDEVSILGPHIKDDLIVQTFSGDDLVLVEGVLGLALEEENGLELDIGDLLSIQTGDGQSEVGLFGLSARQVSILGGRHEDSVLIDVVFAKLDIRVNTQSGDDLVEIGTVEARSLIILTGAGDDQVVTASQETGGLLLKQDLIVNTSSGEDVVSIGVGLAGAAATGEPNGMIGEFDIGDDIVIDTGSDTDLIEVFGLTVGGDVMVNAGAGDDSALENGDIGAEQLAGGVFLGALEIDGNLKVLLGAGRDAAVIGEMFVGGNVFVDAGAGDDGLDEGLGITLGFLLIEGNLLVLLGAGHDDAFIESVEVGGDATVNGGSGNDLVEITDLLANDDLFALMGAGDDELFISASAARKAKLLGGSGRADLYVDGGNDFEDETVREFEQFAAP